MTFTLRNRLRLAAPVLLFGLALPVVMQAASQSAAASGLVGSATTGSSTVQPASESQLLSLTNGARAGAGLAALSSSSVLVSLARGWSAQMAAAHALSHNPNLAGSVSGWYSIGENVAMAASAAQAESLFLGSPEHRANILDRLYNRVGIGIVRAADGTLWITVDFEQTAGYAPSPPAATHHSALPAAHPAQGSAATSPSARLLAERRAAATRANRSLRRQAVESAAVAAPVDPRALSSRLLSQEGGDQAALASAPRPLLAFGPAEPTGSDSPSALVWLGAVALTFVLASMAGQLFARPDRH